jgi:hypothetical protein
VLIEQTVGALGAPVFQNAFGFGAAEPRTVGIGQLRRLLTPGAFLKSFQVDQFPHACLHHAIGLGPAKRSLRRQQPRKPCPPGWKSVGGNKVLSINALARNAVTKPVSPVAEYAPVGSDVI